MALKTDTFKDLIGNLADDAKQALDDILDREEKKSSEPSHGLPGMTAGVAGGVPGMAGGVYGMAGGVPGMHAVPSMPGVPVPGGFAGAAGGLPGSIEGLATLPEQIARLSKLIEALLGALESATSALGARDKGATPPRP